METVIIDNVNVYSVYGLIIAHKDIGIPEKQLMQIEIPGRDGNLDFTDNFYTESKYGNRTITIRFINLQGLNNDMKWPDLLSELLYRFHGKIVPITFSEDDEYFYSGRCSIDGFEYTNGRRVINMTFDCEPYKRLISSPDTKML